MLKKILIFLNKNEEWYNKNDTNPPFLISSEILKGLQIQGSRNVSLSSGAQDDWIYYGSPEYDEMDCGFQILQMTEQHFLGPITVFKDVICCHRLSDLYPVASQRYYKIQTRFGEFRAEEFHIEADGTIKSFLGFVSRFGNAPIFMRGWLSAPVGEMLDPELVPNVINSLKVTRNLKHKKCDKWIADRLSEKAVASVTAIGKNMTEDLL